MEGGRLDVGEVLSLLDEREAACRAEVDRLQAEVERIGGLLSVCRTELERLATARAVVGELTTAYSGRGSAVLARVDGAGVAAAGTEVEVFTDRVMAVLAERDRPVRCQEVATTVGRVEVTRIAYRAPSAANLHPADARLSLPDRMYSFPLQRHVVHEVAGGSLRAAREAIIRGTGAHLGTRQLMQVATEAAVDIRDFYQQTASRPGLGPTVDRRGDLLVLSVDATGVNMIGSDLTGK